MGVEGWVAMRNIPDVSPDTRKAVDEYYGALSSFFSKFKTCRTCKGRGFTVLRPRRSVAKANIKISGIKDLEVAHKDPDVNFSDLIREVLSIELEHRRTCSTCKGKKFLKRRSP